MDRPSNRETLAARRHLERLASIVQSLDSEAERIEATRLVAEISGLLDDFDSIAASQQAQISLTDEVTIDLRSDSAVPLSLDTLTTWIDQPCDGQVTVVGGHDYDLARCLTQSLNKSGVARYLFPSTRVLSNGQNDAYAPALRMIRETELAVLTGWARTVRDHLDGSDQTLQLRTFISEDIGGFTLVAFEHSNRTGSWIAILPERVGPRGALDRSLTIGAAFPENSPSFETLKVFMEGLVRRADSYLVYDVFAKTCAAPSVVTTEDYPDPSRKLYQRLDSQPSDWSQDLAEPEGIPVSLVMLYRTWFGSRALLLHRRGPEKTDAVGQLSLVSNTVNVMDVLAGFADQVKLRDSLGLFPKQEGLASEILHDRLVERYPDRPRSMRKFPIPLAAFRRAASRECLSTLGLVVPPEAFTHHELAVSQTAVTTKSPPVLVEVFSARINAEDFTSIGRERPHASVEFCTMSQIEDADRELNGFLDKSLKEGFLHELLDGLSG